MLLIILQNFLLNHAEPAINLSFDAIDINNVSKPAKFRDNRRVGAQQLWTPVTAHTQRHQQKQQLVRNATMPPHHSHSNLMSDRQMQATSRATTAAPSTTTTTATTSLATKSHNENSGNNGMMIDEIGLGVTSPPSVLSGILITMPPDSMNASTSISSSSGSSDAINSFYFYEAEQFTVLWILFAIIVLGNSAVLITLFLNNKRKSRMNFFIKQLAIADLSVGLLSVLTDIIWRITISWRAGNFACKLIRFMQVSVTYASTYVLVALSIDRFDAITHPMNFSGSWKRAKLLVATSWLLSTLFSLPMFFVYEEKVIQGRMQCWIDLVEPWKWQLYMSLVAATLFVIPALIITACYAVILKTIWAKGASMLPTKRAHKTIELDCRRASSRGIIPKAKVKTVKMTIVIVIVFVLCWSPYIVFDLLQVFDQIPRTQTNIAIATFIQSLAPLNSAANPLIYCLFSTQICRKIRRVFPSLTCCGPTKDTEDMCPNTQRNTLYNTTSGKTFNTSLTTTTSTTSGGASALKRTTANKPISKARVVIIDCPKVINNMSEV